MQLLAAHQKSPKNVFKEKQKEVLVFHSQSPLSELLG